MLETTFQLLLALFKRMLNMEALVIAAFCILFVVVVSSAGLLVFLCCQKRVRRNTSNYVKKIGSSGCRLAKPKNAHLMTASSEVELGEVCLHPDIEQILSDEQWVNEASGLMPHCLAILKLCHLLTNRIIALTMANIGHHRKNLDAFVQIAKKITPRADDVVRSMYAPLDARLLEARTVALVLSVTHLSLVVKYCAVCSKESQEWIDKAIVDMEEHLKVLRDASFNCDAQLKAQNGQKHGRLNESFMYD